ncbi:hypothetical protein Dsin_012125 [Dipteronia sinensis]|uniref:Uncharacterized protein n=1 Tax=Dipteronia sinensis TaxID=43782 RepID=A0AAE0E949_9ROSI|nr:hypothetical protein Dsin_012125 [Dipteronia sinensis]
MSVDQKLRGGPSVGGSTDRSTGGGNNESEEYCSVVIDKNAESGHQIFSEEEMKQWDSLAKALVEEARAGKADDAKPKIQQVPFMLRDNTNFNKYLKPKVISVGPYHYKDTNLKISKPIKLKLAAMFIKETRVNKEALYLHIKNQIKNLRDCYAKEATKGYPDHKLAWIFLVDGCAILQFIFISAQPNSEMELRKLRIKTDHVVFGHQDLFLLDNQLPYQLLQLIMRSTSKEGAFLESIQLFIFDYIKAPGQKYKRNDEILKDNHVHLLDLMRKILIDQPLQNKKKPDLMEIIIDWTVELFDKWRCIDNKAEYWHSFRNIEELKAAGIKLKPSKTSGVKDVTFSGDTLKLPPIFVDDSTAAKFLNMAAYEMCPDFQNDFEVSSYISFLDSLIDRAQDVKELREKNILYNALGSDEEVAKLFNEISTDLVPRDETYSKVRKNIQKYCNNIWMTWLSQFNHDHFQSPWSVLAFVGAFIALASSIIQTVYTALGYHPDSNKGN